MVVEGPVLAGLCGQRLPWSRVAERERHYPSSLCPNREDFEFEPNRCHPFYTRILRGSQNVHFLRIYMATARLNVLRVLYALRILHFSAFHLSSNYLYLAG